MVDFQDPDRKKSDICIVLFFSSSQAIRGEKVSKKAGVKVKLVPIPKHMSAECGFCLVMKDTDQPKVEKALKSNNVEYDRFELI